MNNKETKRQQEICKKYGVVLYPSPKNLKIGIALNAINHNYPLNGMRHLPEGDTTGWYVWAGIGEPSIEDDFFKPLHVRHLIDLCPEIIPFIGLPPGWRFLITLNYEDVWFDAKLI